jgi:hypothetical protein
MAHLIVAAMLLLITDMRVLAKEVLLRCTFQQSVFSVPDPDAAAYHALPMLKSREIRLQTAPELRLLEPKEDDDPVWGYADMRESAPHDLMISWHTVWFPRARNATIELTINRFTGEVREAIRLHNPSDYSDRTGQCAIHDRKF